MPHLAWLSIRGVWTRTCWQSERGRDEAAIGPGSTAGSGRPYERRRARCPSAARSGYAQARYPHRTSTRIQVEADHGSGSGPARTWRVSSLLRQGHRRPRVRRHPPGDGACADPERACRLRPQGEEDQRDGEAGRGRRCRWETRVRCRGCAHNGRASGAQDRRTALPRCNCGHRCLRDLARRKYRPLEQSGLRMRSLFDLADLSPLMETRA